jgi:hypothetical protein
MPVMTLGSCVGDWAPSGTVEVAEDPVETGVGLPLLCVCEDDAVVCGTDILETGHTDPMGAMRQESVLSK